MLAAWQWQVRHAPPLITQQDIDRAVLETLDTQPIPATTRKAADKILPSVVRVVAQSDEREPADPARSAASPRQKAGTGGKSRPAGKLAKPTAGDKNAGRNADPDSDEDPHPRRGVGTGVVIVENGVIVCPAEGERFVFNLDAGNDAVYGDAGASFKLTEEW